MELARLRHILAVSRTRSFSRAAEEERITQPALSRSIAAFERRHGVILFDRGRGGVHPTPAGKLVIEQAHKLLAVSNDLERSLRLYGTGEAGRVALGIGPLMASLLLPELSRMMLAARPGLQIVTITRRPELLLPELLNDGVDMIIGNSWQIDHGPGTEKLPLGTLKLGVTVRAGHPLAHAGTVTSADIAGYPTASAVELSPGGFGGRNGALVCDNFHILREVVLRSDCVWLSSPVFITQELDRGELVGLTVADMEAVDTEICILLRRGRSLSPAAEAVMAEVRELLGAIISA